MRPGRLRSSGLFGLLLVVAAAPTFSCSSGTDPGTQLVAATVQFVQVEGGCWTLLTSDGERYLPRVLPEEFRQDGLPVFVRFEVRPDMGSTCAVGDVVEIEQIRLRT